MYLISDLETETMKRIGLIGGGIIATILIVVAVVPYLIPSEVYKAQIEKQAEAALERDVTLEGDARLSVLPQIAAKIGGVKVANPTGFAAENMIEAGELRARVKFWPLLTGRVEIAEISLVDANVSLERNAGGSANWEFGSSSQQSDTSSEGSGSIDAGIDRARLVNSALSFSDATTGENYALTELNARASMKAFDQPLRFSGDGKLNGQAFDLLLDLSTIEQITKGETADIDVSLETEFGNVSYDGELTLGEIPELSGAFDASSDQLGTITKLFSIDPGINLTALGAISARGNLSGKADALKLDVDRASQSADLLSMSYSGLIDLGSATPLDGAFLVKANNAADAFLALGLDMPVELSPIGSLDIEGRVKGAFEAPAITFERLRQKSDLMTTNYTGLVSISEDIGFDGSLETNISDAGRVLNLFGFPGYSALEKLDFSGDVKGPVSALTVSGAKLAHDGSLLKLRFDGNAAIGGSGQISGPVSASSRDLRGLMEAFSVEMAPGETLRTFELQGNLSGTPLNTTISNLQLQLDEVVGEGQLGLDMTRLVPTIVAELNIPNLDLSPFLGEGSDTPAANTQSTGWSTTPLALDGLRAANADIQLKTNRLTLGDIDLENADLRATLINGDFSADIARLNAFGGDWKGALQLDSSGNIPELAVDMTGSNVAMSSVMSTFANLKTVSGAGDLSFTATSQGQSMDALVRGLNGELKTSLADGTIKGFNVAQIVRSLSSIKSSLADGSLNFGLSPEAETDFTQFNSALTITNGVANIDLMRALNPAVLLDGKGQIDLANQSIDISITPSVDASGVGDVDMLKLNGEPFALPFRVSGSWLSPSVSIDSAAISQQLQAQAISEIGGRITDELGGDLGGLIGDALGVQRQDKSENKDDENSEEEGQTAPGDSLDSKDPKSEPENVEDALEDAVEDLANDALKDLFGRRN